MGRFFHNYHESANVSGYNVSFFVLINAAYDNRYKF